MSCQKKLTQRTTGWSRLERGVGTPPPPSGDGTDGWIVDAAFRTTNLKWWFQKSGGWILLCCRWWRRTVQRTPPTFRREGRWEGGGVGGVLLMSVRCTEHAHTHRHTQTDTYVACAPPPAFKLLYWRRKRRSIIPVLCAPLPPRGRLQLCTGTSVLRR